jgi:hypothetical protein
MTITTANKNPKNDSLYARHRSTWKGQTNVLDSVLTNLRGAPYVTYQAVPYHGTPSEVRHMWSASFRDAKLPPYEPGITAAKIIEEVGYSGVDTWLVEAGAKGLPFTADVKVIWADFARIFAHRSNPGTPNAPGGKTRELLFMCRTLQHFDLIYSKWGREKGKHWFFHWTSDVGAQPTKRPGIDVPSDDEDGESVDND